MKSYSIMYNVLHIKVHDDSSLDSLKSVEIQSS